MNSWGFFIASLLYASLLFSGGVVNAEEDDEETGNEHPFTYDRHGEKGPMNWGKLKPEWQACGSGKQQSPVDLRRDRAIISAALGLLRRTYKPTKATIKNRGHDIMVQWHGYAGGVVINATEYKLQQCHWHFPAEHTVNGRRYRMEIHMVHYDSHGEIAVVGILYKLGRPDPFLSKLINHIKNITEEPMDLGKINPWDIQFGSRKYYRYIGSLTTPPCTEGVIWTILEKVRTVSIEQIRALREAVHDDFKHNARPVQRSHVRSLYLFRPSMP